MSFVRNLFFSVFLGCLGNIVGTGGKGDSCPEGSTPGNRRVPYIGSYGMAHQSEWSGEGKFSQLRGSGVIYGETRMAQEKIIRARMSVFFQKISDAGIHPKGMFWKLNRK